MSDLKNDNKQIRITGSLINDPESKAHLVAYSELIQRDINAIKDYINDTSVNAFKTLAYEDKFDIDGVTDGIDGRTVITKYDSTSSDGDLVWNFTDSRQKSIYESLVYLKALITEINGNVGETESGLGDLLATLRNDLDSLRDMTIGENRTYNDNIDPSVAEHLYQLISQCFNIMGPGVNDLVPDLYNNIYENTFTLNLNVNRENIDSCSDDYTDLNEELSNLYNKLIGEDCFSNASHFGIGGGNCFGETTTSNLKETVTEFENKICDNSRRIDQLEEGVIVGSFNAATDETLGVVELATSAEVSAIASTSNGNPLVMTPGSLFNYYNSAIENSFLSQPAGSSYNRVFGFCFNQKNIEELKNVTINNPQDNQSLVYVNGNWINKLVEGGGGGAVESVNGQTGEVVLTSENIELGADIAGLGLNTNNSVYDALDAIRSFFGGLSDIAFSGESQDANVDHIPVNYELQDSNESNVETHLAGIDEKLNAVIPASATTEIEGIVELATSSEALGGADTNKAITPASLRSVLNEEKFVEFDRINVNSFNGADYPIKAGTAYLMGGIGITPHSAFGKEWRNGDVFIAYEDLDLYTTNSRNVIKITNAERINNLSNVAFTGSYNDLINRPTLGTAAALDVGTDAGNIVTIGNNGFISNDLLDLASLGAGIDNIEIIEVNITGNMSNNSIIGINPNLSNKVLTRVIVNVEDHGKYNVIDALGELEENKKIIFEIKSVNDYASMISIRVVRGGSTTYYPMSTKGNEKVEYNHKINGSIFNFKRTVFGRKKQVGELRIESGRSNYYYFCSEEDSLIFGRNPVVNGNAAGVIDITGAWDGRTSTTGAYNNRLSKFYNNLNQKITVLNTVGYTNLRVRYYDLAGNLQTLSVNNTKEEFYLAFIKNGWPCYFVA